ncbi:MAG TPA: hypothetical protein VGO52_08855 [Hyphomonadaceae bacterium]|jgi:hypothetical protein|nr:hypothetical protein [Hyphomonadaceae bacterium]
MSAKWAFGLALVFLFAASVVALGFMQVKAKPCDETLTLSPMIAFELAQTRTDLEQIFGTPGVECKSEVAGQLHTANLFDTLGYIPGYTAFYLLMAFALGRRDQMLGGIAMALALGCGVADLIENTAMFQLSPVLKSPDWLTVLRISTSIKWIGLGVVTTLGGVMLARRSGWWGWLGLAICIVPLAASLWVLGVSKEAGDYLVPAILLGTAPLAVAAIVGIISKDQSPDA